jgi:hypothetical protein
MSVFIKCGDAAIPVFIQGEETVVSLHTGAKLKRLTVTLQVANDDDDTRASVEGIIQQSLVVETAGIQGQTAPVKWVPKQTSFRYSTDSPLTTYTWELTQEEQLSIKTLQLGDLTVMPYEYVESFDGDGAMTIDARVKLDADQLARLRSLPLYFDVVRNGINQTPREMRLGRVLWSQHEGYAKHDIYLIDRSYDAGKKVSGLTAPEMGNIADQVAESRGQLETLLDILKDKNLLDDGAITLIRQGASERRAAHRADVTRVNDLDEW